MGVTGLWRLIEPAGKPVPVETLENKVLAVDISIWLHQMVKGYQDAKGAPLPNAHLVGLFQRLCKLLYFRIKPVFVFDGAFPELKKETIAKRQENKAKYNSESERLKRELALILTKKTAISSLLGKDISPKKGNSALVNDDDLFKLPALPENKEESDSESDDEQNSSGSIIDLHSVDVESDNFKSLPAKDKYDLLIELKETRKMNSWGKIHELPKKSDCFSDFQMQRLLKRRKVQECLQETEKEMGDGGMSLNELESLLNEEGIDTNIEVLPTRRIASNNTTRYLMISNVKQALAEARKRKELENNPGTSKKETEIVKPDTQFAIYNELEEDLEKAIKMSLECVTENNTSSCTSKTDDSWTSIMSDSDYTDSEEDGLEQPDMTSAKAYIMQYSDFTNKAIERIISTKNNPKTKTKTCNVDEIMDEINNEKSVIVDNINLSSDEEYQPHSKEFDFEKTDFHETITALDAHINETQSSIICVENVVDNVNLSSDEDFEPTEKSFVLAKTESSASQTHINEAQEVIDVENIADNVKSPDKCLSEKSVDEGFTNVSIGNNEVDKNSFNDIINSALEYSLQKNNDKTTKVKVESESSDDEFEEVPEIQKVDKNTVVELILNMGQKSDERDDIFADIFTNEEVTSISSDKFDHKTSNDTFMSKNMNFNKTDSIKSKDLSEKDDTKRDGTLNQIMDVTETIKDNKHSETQSTQLRSSSVEVTIKDIVVNSGDRIANNSNKSKESIREVITLEKLNEMEKDVASEENYLMNEKGRLDRIGRNITEQMTKEAQELLQIFGIPYIVAPMEAEAQCAFLENVKLTDGTITDDSDIWLFGGKTVYKNFFNQKKHVLQFLSERIERSFNLTREQLVLLSLLVGSDYTTGVDGVGPVTAMEILASFPYSKKQLLKVTSNQDRYQQIIAGLQEFKRWVRAGKRTDNTSLKKKLRNVSLNDDFPSIRVVQAYMEPNVERSEDKFTWGELDITILRDYTKAKFGWSQNKLDEIIKPVLKRVTERKSQRTVQDYFKRKVKYQSLEEQMSKRVKAAVQKMGPENANDEHIPTESNEPIPTKKTKSTRKSGSNKAKIKSTMLPGISKTTKNACEINDTVSVVSSIMYSKSGADIVIPKTDRFQEVIPQREKDKQSLLQNKMKAIELFRKTKIDRKRNPHKRKAILPKEKAELSESSESD